MKVGDLVRCKGLGGSVLLGIIVGFDEDNDPKVRDNKTGIVAANWRSGVEVISESR